MIDKRRFPVKNQSSFLLFVGRIPWRIQTFSTSTGPEGDASGPAGSPEECST